MTDHWCKKGFLIYSFLLSTCLCVISAHRKSLNLVEVNSRCITDIIVQPLTLLILDIISTFFILLDWHTVYDTWKLLLSTQISDQHDHWKATSTEYNKSLMTLNFHRNSYDVCQFSLQLCRQNSTQHNTGTLWPYSREVHLRPGSAQLGTVNVIMEMQIGVAWFEKMPVEEHRWGFVTPANRAGCSILLWNFCPNTPKINCLPQL